MASQSEVAVRRARACKTFLEQAHAATAAEGINPSTLHAIKLKLVAFAKRTELFPLADFAMPDAQGRNHPLLVEDNDGYGLYLTIGLPGKEAAPHDHGIWCANAAISGRERHLFYRRTDDGRENGRATVTQIGEVVVQPGNRNRDGRSRHPCHRSRGRSARHRPVALWLCAGAVSRRHMVSSGVLFHACDRVAPACGVRR